MDAQGLRAGLIAHLPTVGCADVQSNHVSLHRASAILSAVAIRLGMTAASLLHRCAGDEIISQQLSFGERAYWEGVVALIGLTLALNLIAYWTLRRCIGNVRQHVVTLDPTCMPNASGCIQASWQCVRVPMQEYAEVPAAHKQRG